VDAIPNTSDVKLSAQFSISNEMTLVMIMPKIAPAIKEIIDLSIR
jgi:hypothetical protein